jgi:peptidoglycan/LPS O-acetylase OafA/YrhL
MGAYAYFICALLVAGEVLVMAEITYRIIEVPGIRFGRNIIVKMQGVTP